MAKRETLVEMELCIQMKINPLASTCPMFPKLFSVSDILVEHIDVSNSHIWAHVIT